MKVEKKKFVASFSGGKDSILALYRAIKAGYEPIGLITTYNEEMEFSWFHNIPKEYLEKVSKALNIPLTIIKTKSDTYTEDFEKALKEFKQLGCDFCVFGDIDIEEHFTWCSERCKNVGLDYLFPLWKENRKTLVYEFINIGFKSIITVVNHTKMSKDFLGKTLNYEIISMIEKTEADICGENGEYHTFVYDGPIFEKSVNVNFSNTVSKDDYSRINFIDEVSLFQTLDLDFIRENIKPLNEEAMKKAFERQNTLIKPYGSLGKIEELSIKLCGISGTLDCKFDKKAIIVMCADNGIYEEGISPVPQEITNMQSINIVKKISGVGVLSNISKSDLRVVDIGVKGELNFNNIIHEKIKNGTNNILKEPAMTREEAMKGILVGINQVIHLYNQGYKVIGTGEMGIGNTTTSSLIVMALTKSTVDETVGRGSGLTDEGFGKKKKIIEEAYNIHKEFFTDSIDILARVGGLDIAGLCGVFIGCAMFKIPVVVDGFISASAALLATSICEEVKNYMIPSHLSMEPGYNIAINSIGLSPYFSLDMRLGEGTGCPFTFLIIDSAIEVLNKMATFEEVAMDNSELVDIRK